MESRVGRPKWAESACSTSARLRPASQRFGLGDERPNIPARGQEAAFEQGDLQEVARLLRLSEIRQSPLHQVEEPGQLLRLGDGSLGQDLAMLGLGEIEGGIRRQL